MLGRSLTSLWSVALIMFASSLWADVALRIDPAPAWREAESMTELAEIFDKWLDKNTSFERAEKKPKIELINPSIAASITGSSASNFGQTRGLFDPASSTIFLIQPWDPQSPHDASVLLHELVHSRQVSRYYFCRAAQEEVAYRIQDDWLRERGLQAKVNWIAVVLESGCNRRDIHPD